jgi:hypothetical protein
MDSLKWKGSKKDPAVNFAGVKARGQEAEP